MIRVITEQNRLRKLHVCLTQVYIYIYIYIVHAVSARTLLQSFHLSIFCLLGPPEYK